MIASKYRLHTIANDIENCNATDILNFVTSITKDCSLYTEEEIRIFYDLLVNRMTELKHFSESSS